MKRGAKVFTATAVALAMCMPLAACTDGEGKGGVTKYTVTYYDQDGVTVLMEQSVSPEGKAYEWTPTKAGYEFDDWYTTTGFNVEYDFNSAVTGNLNVYAKFETAATPITNYTVTYFDGNETLMKQTVADGGKGLPLHLVEEIRRGGILRRRGISPRCAGRHSG